MNLRPSARLGVLAVLALLGTHGVAPLAHADSANDAPARSVRFDDLNLSSPAGVQALYVRIQWAAVAVCGPSEITGTRIVSRAWKDCVSSSIREAVLKVNLPPLTAYYAKHLREPSFTTTG
jgi:UrcA family protein